MVVIYINKGRADFFQVLSRGILGVIMTYIYDWYYIAGSQWWEVSARCTH